MRLRSQVQQRVIDSHFRQIGQLLVGAVQSFCRFTAGIFLAGSDNLEIASASGLMSVTKLPCGSDKNVHYALEPAHLSLRFAFREVRILSDNLLALRMCRQLPEDRV